MNHQKISTEFIADKSTNDCFWLYVNDVRTRVYFFNRPILAVSEAQQKKKSLLITQWIVREEIFPHDSDWKNFNICAPCLFHIKTLKKLDEVPHWTNELIGVQTSRYIETIEHKSIMDQWLGTSQWTQFSKRIAENHISSEVGIYFWHYGYAIYFI